MMNGHLQLILQAAMDLGTFDYRDILDYIAKMPKQKSKGKYKSIPKRQKVIQILRCHEDIVEVSDASRNRNKQYRYVGDFSEDRNWGDCNYSI